MIDRRDRVAGAFDHQVDERAGGKRHRILGQEYAAGSRRILGRASAERSGRPADEFEIRARPFDGQVGDSDNLHAGKLADLCQEHAAELAGPDHADPDRLAGFLKLKKFLMKRHEHTSRDQVARSLGAGARTGNKKMCGIRHRPLNPDACR